MAAADAFNLIAQTARTSNWARETIAWRCAELDPPKASRRQNQAQGASEEPERGWLNAAGGFAQGTNRIPRSLQSGKGLFFRAEICIAAGGADEEFRGAQ